MPEEGEKRKVVGKVEYIGDIKAIGEKGKFLSLGIRLEGEEEWHNITGFSRNKILQILGKTKVGDNVELTEEYRSGYWNIVDIKNIAEVMVKQEKLKEELIKRGQVEAPVEKIELSDVNTMVKCFEDAKEILKRVTQSEESIKFLSPELVSIALTLFKYRTKCQ